MLIRRLMISALLFSSRCGQLPAYAQSYVTAKCSVPAGGSLLPAGSVYLLYTGPQGYPLCMQLGAEFKTSIDPITKLMKLSLATPPAPALRMKQIVEVVKQPEVNLPQSLFTLAFTPAPDTLLNVVYDSPVTGRLSYMVLGPQGDDRKLLQITWEPANGNPEPQQVRVVYWTYEALALAVTTAAPINTVAPVRP